MVAKNLVNDILSLPPSDRLELAERIWESLEREEVELPLSDWQIKLLDERLEDMQKSPQDITSWDEVDAKLRKRKK